MFSFVLRFALIGTGVEAVITSIMGFFYPTDHGYCNGKLRATIDLCDTLKICNYTRCDGVAAALDVTWDQCYAGYNSIASGIWWSDVRIRCVDDGTDYDYDCTEDDLCMTTYWDDPTCGGNLSWTERVDVADVWGDADDCDDLSEAYGFEFGACLENYNQTTNGAIFTCNEQEVLPTLVPTTAPTDIPTTLLPSSLPTVSPTSSPTKLPTEGSTIQPSVLPTTFPSTSPTKPPTVLPTTSPTTTPTGFEGAIAQDLSSEEDTINLHGLILSSRTVTILILVPLSLAFCCFCAFLLLCPRFCRKKEGETREPVMCKTVSYESPMMDNDTKASAVAGVNFPL